MSAICGFLVAIIIMIGIPTSIILLIIFAIKKKGVKVPLCCLGSCILLIIILSLLGTYSRVKSNEYQDYLTQRETEENKEEEAVSQENSVVDELMPEESITQELTDDNDSAESETQSVDAEYSEAIETETPTEEPYEKNTELTEEEYKELCIELWYDDIFFSEEDLEGQHVKLELFIEEAKYFKADSIYNSTIVDFINKYNLQRNLYACGVLREDASSYVGGQIYLYFSDDYNYKSSDFETGQEIIIYGEIVDYSTNTWDGYNTCGVIPRYIEVK